MVVVVVVVVVVVELVIVVVVVAIMVVSAGRVLPAVPPSSERRMRHALCWSDRRINVHRALLNDLKTAANDNTLRCEGRWGLRPWIPQHLLQ